MSHDLRVDATIVQMPHDPQHFALQRLSGRGSREWLDLDHVELRGPHTERSGNLNRRLRGAVEAVDLATLALLHDQTEKPARPTAQHAGEASAKPPIGVSTADPHLDSISRGGAPQLLRRDEDLLAPALGHDERRGGATQLQDAAEGPFCRCSDHATAPGLEHAAIVEQALDQTAYGRSFLGPHMQQVQQLALRDGPVVR